MFLLLPIFLFAFWSFLLFSGTKLKLPNIVAQAHHRLLVRISKSIMCSAEQEIMVRHVGPLLIYATWVLSFMEDCISLCTELQAASRDHIQFGDMHPVLEQMLGELQMSEFKTCHNHLKIMT